MRKRLMSILILGVCLLAGCGKAEEISKDEKNINVVNLAEKNKSVISIDYTIDGYDAVQDFSYVLFQKNVVEQNPVVSPVSAYLALALAGKGAEGETREAFENVLQDMECIPHDLMSGLPGKKDGMLITINNSAWVDKHLTPCDEWLAWADSVYQAEVLQADFAEEDTYQQMNQWISKKTRGMIDKLYNEPLDKDTRLVLLNTLYFKAKWRIPFESQYTKREIFTLEEGTEVKVEMMNMGAEYLNYVRDAVSEGVILPYEDPAFVFMALKPRDGMTVREMYNQLTFESINAMLDCKETTVCNLKLPRFEVEFHKILNDSLKQMGLEIAFTDGVADFSGIGTLDDGPNMYIAQVQQKSKMIVDEEGTEAAAVTSVEMTKATGIYVEEMPVEIYFDEPFLYMIMDRERKVPLFMGIMDNPSY